MKKRLWIVGLCAGVALSHGMESVSAQPETLTTDRQGAARFDAMTSAELERAIGGRTTLELKFKDLTTEKVTDAVAQSSRLPFVAPAPVNNHFTVNGVLRTVPPDPKFAPTWDGDVAQTDFWLALRNWGREENVRLTRERAALQESRNGAAPIMLKSATGARATREELAEQQKQTLERIVERNLQLQRVNPDGTLSARFDDSASNWRLAPDSQLLEGRAFNAWPCLLLATEFRREQRLSIREAAPPQDSPPPEKTKNDIPSGNEKTPTAKTPTVKAPPTNQRGEETVTDGLLRDALTLDLLIYLEPKLWEKARLNVRVDEARDDNNEDLLPQTAALGRPIVRRGIDYFDTPISNGEQESRVVFPLSLRPRQAQSQKLAVLRGVVTIRYPLKSQKHEITNFAGTQEFLVNTFDLPVKAQFEPPHLEDGQLKFSTSLELETERGWRSVSNWGDGVGPLGQPLLPQNYTFTDNQGRAWIGNAGSGASMPMPNFEAVPVTSPPTPLPDDIKYSEQQEGNIVLPLPNFHSTGESVTFTPEELAKVRFVKASFTTESDWRTLEVPFEFRDLPLPPR